MKTIQVTLADETHARLKDAAWAARKSLGDMVRLVLDQHLPRPEPETPIQEAKLSCPTR
jgi:hypothetical protein